MEDEEELVCVVMAEIKICHREIWSIIDKIELGYHQLIWRKEVISEPEIPPEPEPSRFSDWSSLGSLPARTLSQSTPYR